MRIRRRQAPADVASCRLVLLDTLEEVRDLDRSVLHAIGTVDSVLSDVCGVELARCPPQPPPDSSRP